MPPDPYDILGVPRTASADDIRRAYRSLAKQSHPDLHPGNKTAEERFKSINTANDLLSDPEKRARFDRGEIDAAGDPRHAPPPHYSDFAQGPRGAKYTAGAPPFGESFNPGEMDDIFEFLNQGPAARSRRAAGPRRGRDRTYSLDIDFRTAITGGTQRLTLPDSATIDVRIPPGLESGRVLRLRQKGDPGRDGADPGDALVEVFVRPDPIFTRDGNDIALDLPVSLAEATLGARIEVPTTSTPVTLTIPPGSSNGARLRLRGRGVPARGQQPAGDQYVTLRLVLDPADTALAGFLRDRPAQDFNPRRDWDGAR